MALQSTDILFHELSRTNAPFLYYVHILLTNLFDLLIFKVINLKINLNNLKNLKFEQYNLNKLINLNKLMFYLYLETVD